MGPENERTKYSQIAEFIATKEGQDRLITEIGCHLAETAYPGYGETPTTLDADAYDNAEELEGNLCAAKDIEDLKRLCREYKLKQLIFPDPDTILILEKMAYDRFQKEE